MSSKIPANSGSSEIVILSTAALLIKDVKKYKPSQYSAAAFFRDNKIQPIARSMTPKKIPLFLLTGFLGSGKTSLLKNWLESPVLKDSALIINELGEVGVDQALLTSAAEAASLVANACVCCTGLQGLSQALEDLFWARLQRRVHKFPQLIIETTGLAMPGPILQTLHESPLLLERYEWAGTITCVSATSLNEVMREFKEAQAQLIKADLCILTKIDLIGSDERQAANLALREFLAHHDLSTPVLNSSQASLSATHVLEALKVSKDSGQKSLHSAPLSTEQTGSLSLERPMVHLGQDSPPAHLCEDHRHDPDMAHEGHGHDHNSIHSIHSVHSIQPMHQMRHPHHHLHAHAHFWHMPETIDLSTRQSQVQNLKTLLGKDLLRLKGWVQTTQGVHLIQMSPFDTTPQIQAQEPLASPNSEQAPRPWGLTVIVKEGLLKDQAKAMKALLER